MIKIKAEFCKTNVISDHCFVVRPKKALWLGATPRGYLSRMAMTHTTHDAVGAGAVGGERFGMRLTDCSSRIEQSNVPAPATAMSTADATGVGEMVVEVCVAVAISAVGDRESCGNVENMGKRRE